MNLIFCTKIFISHYFNDSLVSTKVKTQLFVNSLFHSRIFQKQFIKLKPIHNGSRHNVELIKNKFKCQFLGKIVVD